MLELQDLTLLRPDGHEEDAPILGDLVARIPVRGHFLAVVGPSGCGKSTLLKVIAGLAEPSAGRVLWEGRDLAAEGDLAAHEVGYVPQFSIAYDALTVRESVETASRLRLSGGETEERRAGIEAILEEAGLAEIAERRVQVLSGGQRRRLALALEMVASPRLLLCDEVTSGLDPKSEDEIVHLLARLSRTPERLVVSVTHSLRHLALCDGVLVLYGGRIAYHGLPEHLYHYFGAEKHEDLFTILGSRPAEKWHTSWQKHRETYYAQAGIPETAEAAPLAEHPPTPGALTQWWILLRRRWLLFVRDRAQLGLHLALLFGFPLLVVVFALNGLPQLKSLAAPVGSNVLQQMLSDAAQRAELVHTGSLVSGLIMFQVILLALMGSNNAAREIAGERLIFEKEKFSGLSPLAYVASKAVFLGVLAAVQSVWMALFVNFIVRFPGPLGDRLWILLGTNAAITFVCLGISASLRKAEHASLVSIYLVGFQLPLSGAVLALPAGLNLLTRPFIASYWGWSGFIQTMRETRFYEAIGAVTQTTLSPASLCLWVLVCHCLVGLYVALVGCSTRALGVGLARSSTTCVSYLKSLRSPYEEPRYIERAGHHSQAFTSAIWHRARDSGELRSDRGGDSIEESCRSECPFQRAGPTQEGAGGTYRG